MTGIFSVLDSLIGGTDGIGGAFPVGFTGHIGAYTWGSSRKWNSWVEIMYRDTLIASSADGDFAVTSGKITEDIGRPVRRDVQLSLTFPQLPRRMTMPVLQATVTGTPIVVGSSNVGSTDRIGGVAAAEAVVIPPVEPESTRPLLIPTTLGSVLDPNSLAHLRIHAGFVGEEVLMGYFDLASTEVKDGGSGPVVDITGQSFERRLNLAGFWQMNGFGASQPAVSAAMAVILEAMPQTQFIVTQSAATIGELTWKSSDNRLTKITDLLTLAGMEGGFNRSNVFTIQPAPIPSSFGTQQAQWDVIDGVNARVATLNTASRKFSDEDSFNGVVVEGTSQSTPNTPPVSAVVWNTNQTSPLYFDPTNPGASTMGPRAKFVHSELAHTTNDAYSIAQIELAKVLMLTDTIDAEVPANAEIQMGHFVRLVCDSLGVDGIYRVARVVHDLAGGPASLSLYHFTKA